jgi:DNA primase
LKDDKGQLFDRFRGRVIFPFFSVSGKVTGFAGRLIKQSDKAGKYVNSPTSILYEKKHELYGFYQAKQAIKREDCCYLVEGQLDVIQLVQSGIENVVASGGTALTYPQIRLLHRFAENVTILYDGDNAGIKAALRGIDMMIDEGVNVKIVLLPEGEDPDSFARKHNATEVLEYIEKNQTDFIRFKAQLLSKEAGDDPTKRAAMINAIINTIAIIPDIIKRQVYIKECAQLVGLSENVLTKKVIEVRESIRKKAKERPVRSEEAADNAEPVAVEPEGPTVQVAAPAEENLTGKEQNIRNLIQLIVRYGEKVLFQTTERDVLVGEYIINELHRDSVEMTNPLYKKVIEKYQEHYREDGWEAAKYFKFNPDLQLSQMAVEMLADKYQLSRIYAQQIVSENVVKEAELPSELDVLPDMVQRMLLELKFALVNERIDAMQALLNDAQQKNDWVLIRAILEQQPKLIEIRQQLCKSLGNRVILR